jgi:hypothetical protein
METNQRPCRRRLPGVAAIQRKCRENRIAAAIRFVERTAGKKFIAHSTTTITCDNDCSTIDAAPSLLRANLDHRMFLMESTMKCR